MNARNFLNFSSISSFFIEFLILFLVIFSPLIYASVTIFPLTIIEITSLVLILLFTAKVFFDANSSTLAKLPYTVIVLFIALILLQLLALPRQLLQFLSPGTANLYRDFALVSKDYLTLSVYPDATVGMILQFLSYLFVFFVAVNYFNTEKKIKRIIMVIILTGFVYSFYGVIRRFTTEGVGFSTFTNRNHFSAYIQMVIPLAIGYSLTKKSIVLRFIFIFLAAIMFLALFFALSRAGIICAVLSLIILGIILKMKFMLKKEAGIVILAVIIFAVLLGMFSGLDPTMQRLKTLLNPFQALAGRLSLVKDTFSIIRDFPVWGVGFGALGEIFQKYKNWQGLETFSFTHNESLQLMAETGLAGFFLMALFISAYFKNILLLLFKRHNPYVIYLSLGCLVGITSIFLHSFFDFVFHIPANSILFVIILALINKVLYIRKDGAPSENGLEIDLPRYMKVIFISVFSLVFLLGVSLVINRYKAEQIFQSIGGSGPGISKPEVIFKYRRELKVIDNAISLNPLNASFHNKKADVFSELAVKDELKRELLNFKEFGDRERLLFLAERSYGRAIELNPTRADYHLRLGWFYGLRGEDSLAKKEFDKAMLLDPRNYSIKAYIDGYYNKTLN